MKKSLITLLLTATLLFAADPRSSAPVYRPISPVRVFTSAQNLWSINEYSAVADHFRTTNSVYGRIGNQSSDRNVKQYVIQSSLTGLAVPPKTNFFVKIIADPEITH